MRNFAAAAAGGEYSWSIAKSGPMPRLGAGDKESMRRSGAASGCGARRRQQEKEMAKSQRRGNKEARKPKTAKPASAAPVSPFVVKGAAVPNSPPKRKG